MKSAEPKPFQFRPENSVGNRKQLILVGAFDPATAKSLVPDPEVEVTLIPAQDWEATNWLEIRKPMPVWVLVDAQCLVSSQAAARCCQSLSLGLRPIRLGVVVADLRGENLLTLLHAGASDLYPQEVCATDVGNLLRQERFARERFFSDPAQWLHPLAAAAEILTEGEPDPAKLNQLCRLFAQQLGVERVSIALRDDLGILRVAASYGLAAEFLGTEVRTGTGTITGCVLESKLPRLLIGRVGSSTTVTSGIAVPLLEGTVVLGTLNFSTLRGDALLTQAELATAEVLAQMVAAALLNQRLQKELARKQRLSAIGETISVVSHCLKNVLTVVQGSVFLVERDAERGHIEDVRRSADMLKRGTHRLENLVLDLLDFSKERAPDLKEVAITSFLEDLRASVLDGLPVDGRRVRVECSTHGTFALDTYRLERALLNLVRNAVDATVRDVGEINLLVLREADSLVFSVSDNGPGVAPEHMPHLFEPFFSTKGSRGTGLGLAMVDKFAHECGGSIRAERSDSLGGMRMVLTLPAIHSTQETTTDADAILT